MPEHVLHLLPTYKNAGLPRSWTAPLPRIPAADLNHLTTSIMLATSSTMASWISLLAAGQLMCVTGFTTMKSRVFMEKTIDPIVFPGIYNLSHLHQFAGSTGVTAHTKHSSELRQHCTTTENPCDFSAYWWPALINKHTNEAIKPYLVSIYYQDVDTAEMTIPEDLKLIAGNSHNQDLSKVDKVFHHFCLFRTVIDPF